MTAFDPRDLIEVSTRFFTRGGITYVDPTPPPRVQTRIDDSVEWALIRELHEASEWNGRRYPVYEDEDSLLS